MRAASRPTAVAMAAVRTRGPRPIPWDQFAACPKLADGWTSRPALQSSVQQKVPTGRNALASGLARPFCRCDRLRGRHLFRRRGDGGRLSGAAGPSHRRLCRRRADRHPHSHSRRAAVAAHRAAVCRREPHRRQQQRCGRDRAQRTARRLHDPRRRRPRTPSTRRPARRNRSTCFATSPRSRASPASPMW